VSDSLPEIFALRWYADTLPEEILATVLAFALAAGLLWLLKVSHDEF
jgi:hypothetical protein